MTDLVETKDKKQRILDAAIEILGRDGISGLTMRAVGTEAGVALGLMNYYFEDKRSLIAAALTQVGEADLEFVTPLENDTNTDGGTDRAVDRLTEALRRVAEPRFLTPAYLGRRLQLWALSTGDPQLSAINQQAQTRYRDQLAELISAARPDLSTADAVRRADDVLLIQNGMWLTAALIRDDEAIGRAVEQTVGVALSPARAKSDR